MTAVQLTLDDCQPAWADTSPGSEPATETPPALCDLQGQHATSYGIHTMTTLNPAEEYL